MFSSWEAFLGILGIGVAVGGISYRYNKRFLEWLRFHSIGTRDYIAERLSSMFIEIPPNTILIGQFTLSFGLGSVVFLLLLPKWFLGLLLGGIVMIVGWKVPKPVVDMMYSRRVSKLVAQMVDGLGLMSNGMKSGLSVVQAMGLVTQEMQNPIRQEFELILNENKLGVSLEEAFTNFSKRVKSDDVEMFVTSVNILKETGGNLAETFDTIVSTIRERVKVENKIKALTSQGLVQGIFVMSVPPVLGFLLYQSDPDFMRPLFTTTIGLIVCMVIVVLEVIAFFIIRKIVTIDV
ncbi:MAG: type II secretion system F family protein [Bdellovibrionales bacterium]|nr:type II secretion system F family protein [Bdellovibrionales bacterium]